MTTRRGQTARKVLCTAILALSSSFFTLASAQENQKVVTGRVVDAATGQPLAGVIVSAYGDQRLTSMTDEDGRYELKVTKETRSVIMRVDGYGLQQRAISDDKADGCLYSSAFTTDYKRVTTATTVAQANKFENNSELSIDPLISQQLGADVRTVTRSGIPGMGNMMFIEGINSLNASAQPLVVIDGVLMDMQYTREMLHDGYYNNMLANINVNDIETVTVLKNGTALYGAKGANGVILINTKRNKSMATKIDVTINGRYELVPRLPKMLGAEDYRLYSTELLADHMSPTMLGKMKYLNNEPTYYYYNQYHNSTDWSDLTYENAFSQNYGINVQGGDDIASYNLSVGYSLGNSTLKSNDFSRFNMRLNTDISISKKLDVRFDASYSDVDRDLRDDGAPEDPLGTVITSTSFLGLTKAPFLSPYAFDMNGNISHYLSEADDYLEGKFQGRGRLANPLSILKYGDGKNRNKFGNRLITFAITPRYQFNKNLTLSEHFVLSLVNTNENYYLPRQGVPAFVVRHVCRATHVSLGRSISRILPSTCRVVCAMSAMTTTRRLRKVTTPPTTRCRTCRHRCASRLPMVPMTRRARLHGMHLATSTMVSATISTPVSQHRLHRALATTLAASSSSTPYGASSPAFREHG